MLLDAEVPYASIEVLYGNRTDTKAIELVFLDRSIDAFVHLFSLFIKSFPEISEPLELGWN